VNVVVLGSLNIDFAVRTHRLPRPGETIFGEEFTTTAGGKGANQAAAVARLGASTKMIGRVGRDVFGEMLRDALESERVDIGAVAIDEEAETGTALITVSDDGANSIVVVPGANAAVGREELDALNSVIERADVLLLQLEIPIEVVEEAASIAESKGVAVILDPAPALPLPEGLLRRSTWITPNEHEAEILTGISLTDEVSVAAAARRLLDMGANNVVITLGSRGCYFAFSEEGFFVPAPRVKSIDSVGAGDAFNGAMAVGLAQKLSVKDLLVAACEAGANASASRGARPTGS
jgi:ribokinase